jgi:hypothetical protein
MKVPSMSPQFFRIWRQDLCRWQPHLFMSIQNKKILLLPSPWPQQSLLHARWQLFPPSANEHISLERRQLLIEIDRLMSVDPSEVPEESKFLLEIDFRAIRTASTERQSYWVHAVRAAIKAGRAAHPLPCGSASGTTTRVWAEKHWRTGLAIVRRAKETGSIRGRIGG